MNQSNQATTVNPFVNTNSIAPYASGTLNGLSFAIKDNIDVENEITSYGCPGWKETHSTSAANAICLEQLLSEGGHYTLCDYNSETTSNYNLVGRKRKI